MRLTELLVLVKSRVLIRSDAGADNISKHGYRWLRELQPQLTSSPRLDQATTQSTSTTRIEQLLRCK